MLRCTSCYLIVSSQQRWKVGRVAMTHWPTVTCWRLIGERKGQRLAEVTSPSGNAPFLPAAKAVQWTGGGRRLKSLQGTVCFSWYPWGALGQREVFFFLLLLSELATGRTGNWASAMCQVLCANKMKCPEPGSFLLCRSPLHLGLIFLMSQGSLGGCNTLPLGL